MKFLSLAFLILTFSLHGAVDFESLTGLKGQYDESKKVFSVKWPRDDVKIIVNGITMDPFMGLTSWVAFKPLNDNESMIMGDLVLLQDEVNPVLSTLLKENFSVTALHNHFFFDTPKVYYMHIEKMGDIKKEADGIKAALATSKEIRRLQSPSSAAFMGSQLIARNAISPEPLENVFKTKGQKKEGLIKFVFGREVKVDGEIMGKEMGVNGWVAFGGTDQQAYIDGDIAVTEKELQETLSTLRKGNIQIVSIHNHMINETPRLLFIHYFGEGEALDLAKKMSAVFQKLPPSP